MGPGHGGVTGELLGLFIGARDEALLQTAPYFLGARLAAGPLTGQEGDQLRIFFIYPERHYVDLVVLPPGGDLDPAHQSQRQLFVLDRLADFIKPVKGVVVSDR
ncbi:hypothetical protein D3C84_515350 [compost metagenome]